MDDRSLQRWFVRPRPNPAAGLRLVCVPHAGAGASVFHQWPARLPATVEVCAVELPGRGRRFREPLVGRLDAHVETITAAVARWTDKPFALFGHSMGALVSFEVARRCRRLGQRGPVHLFASGHPAPQIPDDGPRLSGEPDDRLIEWIRRWEGTPAELLAEDGPLPLMLPALRADLAACEAYRYEPGPPLECPISVLGGLQDETVPVPCLQAWSEQTTSGCVVQTFPGGHFFLQTDEASVLRALAEELNRACSAGLARQYAAALRTP